jgi:hypothetical protein
MNKRKIFNDPLYGFISIHSDLIFDIIEHPYFQRLRRIKQLGLTDLVYPGANHTRFHHALGAMHLMEQALTSLRNKGYDISDYEFESALIAILLHDMGHGPFSHVLENSILSKVHHEYISLLFMQRLNQEFKGGLSLAIEIFKGTYERHFLHQLVSSQLDTDRLDYLNRDSYFTGVSEGIVSADRIVRMLEIVNDEIAIQEKGIYSIENFLNSRRLMYWQVYLHKTTICAEEMLIQIVKRAKFLVQNGEKIYATQALELFLKNDYTQSDFETDKGLLDTFGKLDDLDIWSGIKAWSDEKDATLSLLCNRLINRNLFKLILSKEEFSSEYLLTIDNKLCNQLAISTENLAYLRVKGELSNLGYISSGKKINILKKSGDLVDITYASDLPNIKAISEIVKKFYLCAPAEAFMGFFK